MSNKKVSDLADGGAVQATDEFYAQRGSSQVKIAGSALGGSLPDPITVPVEISPADMDARAGFKLNTPLGSFFQWINEAFDDDAADGSVCITTTQDPGDGEYLWKLVAVPGNVLVVDSDGATTFTVHRDSAMWRVYQPTSGQNLLLLQANGHTYFGTAFQAFTDPVTSIPALGFFDKINTPVTQPAAPVTLADVIAALQTLGLVAT